MFLVPFCRKSILNLFVFSSHSTLSTSSTTPTSLVTFTHSALTDHKRPYQNYQGSKQANVITFIFKSSVIVVKVFINSLSLVRQWLNYLLEVSLSAALNYFISSYHHHNHLTELQHSTSTNLIALPAPTDTNFSDNSLEQFICLEQQLCSYFTPHLIDNQSPSITTTKQQQRRTNFCKVCSGARLTEAQNNWSETKTKPVKSAAAAAAAAPVEATRSRGFVSAYAIASASAAKFCAFQLDQCECNNNNCSNKTNSFVEHNRWYCKHHHRRQQHEHQYNHSQRKMDFYQARRIAQRAVSAQANNNSSSGGKHVDSLASTSNPSSCLRDYSGLPPGANRASGGSGGGGVVARPVRSMNNGTSNLNGTSAQMAMVGRAKELEAADDAARAELRRELKHAAQLLQGHNHHYQRHEQQQRQKLDGSDASGRLQLVSTAPTSAAGGSITSGSRREFPQFAQRQLQQQQQQQQCHQLHKQQQKQQQQQLEKSLHHNLQTPNSFKYSTCTAEASTQAEPIVQSSSSTSSSSSSSSAVSSLIHTKRHHHHHHHHNNNNNNNNNNHYDQQQQPLRQQQEQPQRHHHQRLDNKQEQSVYDNAVHASDTVAGNASAPTHIEQGSHRASIDNNDLLGAEAGNISSERRQNNIAATAAAAAAASVRTANTASAPLLLISKSELNDLTEQIAFSLSKMKDLEEQVRIIPDLQRRLDQVVVMSDSCSSSLTGKDYANSNNINSNSNNSNNNNIINNSSSNSIIQHSQQHHHLAHSNHRRLHNTTPTRFNSVERVNSRESNRFFNLDIDNNNDNNNNNNNNNSNSSRVSSLRLEYSGNNASVSNRNLTSITNTSTEDVFKGVHPLLQRHYNSFRQQHHQHQHQQQQQQQTPVAAHKVQSSTPLASATPAGARYTTSSDNSSSSACTHPHQHHIHHQHQHQQHQAPFGLNFNQTHTTSHNHLNMNHANASSAKNHYSSSYISSRHSNNHSNTYNNGNVGSLSLQTTPVKSTPLDCGCQSFKEHLKYNSISREQRLNAQQQQVKILNQINHSSTSNSNPISPNSTHPLPHIPNPVRKVDASTNTDLTMDDVVTKEEMNNMMANMQKTFSNLSSWILNNNNSEKHISSTNHKIHSKLPQRTTITTGNATKLTNASLTTIANNKSLYHKSSSLESESTSGSISGPKSSSPLDSRSTDDEGNSSGGNVNDDDVHVDDDDGELKSDCSSNDGLVDEIDQHSLKQVNLNEDNDCDEEEVNVDEAQPQDDDHDNDGDEDEEEEDEEEQEEEEEEEDGNSVNSPIGEEPYSLGSSYQDPSDFEEYCAYGESLDRRTKDFMSQATKIPNDLRFALIRLNEFIKRNCSFEHIESTSNCVEVIRKDWFKVAANKDSQPIITQLYVDYFESFTKQLLNTVVNLTDSAGNTALHYAASHYKLDIIKILLGTKVCDVNCRNRAGYTSIMLLALGEIPDKAEEQEIAKCLFSIGDVNIKARSSGQTALMLAASHGRATTCKLLLECGADPSLKDHDGSTALMCGSEIGDEDVVKCLLAHKLTDPTVTDNDGLDALTIAMNNGHKSIGLILYAAKNVPRMGRTKISQTINSHPNNTTSNGQYSAGSLRKSRGKVMATSSVRRTAFTCWSKR